MSTCQQRDDFSTTLIPSDLLDTAIEWIKTNLTPEDVFDEEALVEWAHGEGYHTDEEVGATSQPEDIFQPHELRNWAENNGYVEEE